MSPSARSKALLEKHGWTVGTVERWNPHAGPISEKTGKRVGRRHDLFGFLDQVAIKPGHPVLGIQATSRGNTSSRCRKIEALPDAVTWLGTQSLIYVLGWDKRLVGRATRWRCQILEGMFFMGSWTWLERNDGILSLRDVPA